MSDLEFQEIWQIDVGGEIYEASFEVVTQWIAEGAVLRGDKVRRGNLRWLEAGKVPSLLPFFNAKDSGIETPLIAFFAINAENPAETVQTQTENLAGQPSFSQNKQEPENFNSSFFEQTQNFNTYDNGFQTPADSCAVHSGDEPKYRCESCQNLFCKACPTSYGGSVKVCPLCGAMCRLIADVRQKRQREFQYQTAATEGFGFSDFARALAHPFKYKTSLVVGATMFMFFTLGQSAGGFGGFFMVVASFFCLMSANMLTFGVLANTVENFSQGKLETNFMPDFDDFNLWDDMVHPFFLSIGVYLTSFGPLILTVIIGVYLMVSTVSSEIQNLPTQPPIINNLQNPQEQFVTGEKLKHQSEEVKRLLEKRNAENPSYPMSSAETTEQNDFNEADSYQYHEEKEFEELQELINQHRQAQLQSVVGKSPEDERAMFGEMISNLLGVAVPFLVIAFIALLWGIFYFPAACAVAGYTRSFAATINPLVGLDTIKRLGMSYFKILLMMLLLFIIASFIGLFLNLIFLPFDMPVMGNLPAKAVSSLFTFYFSVMFSCILGYALFKNADKLKLYKG